MRFGEGAPCCCCCARPGDGRSHRLLPSQQRVDSGVLLEGTGQLSPAQTNQGRLLGQNNIVQGRVFCSIRSIEGIINKPYWVVGKVSPWHKCAHFSLPCPLFPLTSLPPSGLNQGHRLSLADSKSERKSVVLSTYKPTTESTHPAHCSCLNPASSGTRLHL